MTLPRGGERRSLFAAVGSLLLVASASLGAACEGGDEVTRGDGGDDGAIPALGDGSTQPTLDSGADAREGSVALCPAGSTLRRAAATCPGAPLLPPAALTNALMNASPGAVVSMAGMSEATAPCLPVIVCTPDDAPTMLFSDSPEAPVQDGVLYADTLPKGRYRIYVYHANGGTSARKFPIVALNSGAQPATITIVRKGLAAPSAQYVSLGKKVLLDWLVDRAPAVVVVPAGARVLLDGALDQLHASQNELVHAIYDLVTDASLKLSVVSVTAGVDAADATAGLPLLPRDANHQRGTFPAADVLLVSAPVAATDGGAGRAAQQRGVQRIRLGVDEIGDALHGVDAPTGEKQTLLGNYGMRYRFALGLASPATMAISPRGGAWGGVARASTTAVALPSAAAQLASTTDAVVVGAAGGSGEVELLTGGGSNLPIDVFLVTP